MSGWSVRPVAICVTTCRVVVKRLSNLLHCIVYLCLLTLKYKNLRGDIIEVFKIIKHQNDYKVALELIYNINKVARGNDFRLSKNRGYYGFRKF